MLRWWYRLAASLSIMTAALIGGICVSALSRASQPVWSTPHSNCTIPCWEGIYPGRTPTSEAVDILNHHPWVKHVWGVSNARWTWSGQQPTWIDASRPGTLSIRYGRVEQIGIPTHLATGDFWILHNQLEKGVLFNSGLTSRVYQFSDAGDYWIVSDLSCPLRLTDFWRRPVQIILGDMTEFEQQNALDYTDYAATGWQRNLSC